MNGANTHSYTCTKRYADIPFAHRQHQHDGHCAWIHGHNWSFEFTFAASELDENGFVVDFGKLRYLADFLKEHFDHAFVYSEGDITARELVRQHASLFKPLELPQASAEGIAAYVFDCVAPMVKENSGGRAWLANVVVCEDTKNRACYERS